MKLSDIIETTKSDIMRDVIRNNKSITLPIIKALLKKKDRKAEDDVEGIGADGKDSTTLPSNNDITASARY